MSKVIKNVEKKLFIASIIFLSV